MNKILDEKEREEVKEIYKKPIVEVVYGYHQMYKRIIKAIEILEKYNDNENNYYVPVNEVLEILKGSDKE